LNAGAVFTADRGHAGMDLHVHFNAFDAIIASVNERLIETYPAAMGTLFRVARRNKSFLQLCCHLCRSGI
jgi:hypothetical protein